MSSQEEQMNGEIADQLNSLQEHITSIQGECCPENKAKSQEEDCIYQEKEMTLPSLTQQEKSLTEISNLLQKGKDEGNLTGQDYKIETSKEGMVGKERNSSQKQLKENLGQKQSQDQEQKELGQNSNLQQELINNQFLQLEIQINKENKQEVLNENPGQLQENTNLFKNQEEEPNLSLNQESNQMQIDLQQNKLVTESAQFNCQFQLEENSNLYQNQQNNNQNSNNIQEELNSTDNQIENNQNLNDTNQINTEFKQEVEQIVNNFFKNAEHQAFLRAQQQKKMQQFGKENECSNANNDVETPKYSIKSQEKIEQEEQMSPEKKRKLKMKEESEFEEESGKSPGKQDSALNDQQQCDPSNQNEQEEMKCTRAPFSDLLNNNKKQQDQEVPNQKHSRLVDVNKVIFVDSLILNYSTFFPGKLLGSTLNVGNQTNSEQIVELAIDSNSFQYSKKQIGNKFGNPELPYSLEQNENGKKNDNIVNSEIKHESWYIENPISKELTKRITLKLGPKAEQDFIIVVRSPNSKKSENLMSIINIGLLTYADEQFGVKENFEDFLKVNYNNSMKEFLRDRKKVAQSQRIEILLAGRIEVPILKCQKELIMANCNEKVVPLVVKKGLTNQKFRIPFKNNCQQDLDVEFSFAKQSAVVKGPNLDRLIQGNEDEQSKIQSPIEFQAVPSCVKIAANGNAILNISAKLKNSYQLMQMNKDQSQDEIKLPKGGSEMYNHLLIAKIKDTQLMFSYIIEASVIEASANINSLS